MADDLAPRSRRSLIAGALAGVAGLVAGRLSRPEGASAAAGDPLILGEANSSGTAQTTLTNNGLGAAFTLRTTNVSTGATGIFGWSSQTGNNATRGVYGKADARNSYGVFGVQDGPVGNGAAVYAEGRNNHSVVATSTPAALSTVPAYYLKNAVRAVGPDAIVGVTSGPEANGFGVSGVAVGAEGVALYGEALHSAGVTFGVLGYVESPLGWAVYAAGDAGVEGDLFVAGDIVTPANVSRIDHPLDPAGSYLQQASVESAELKTVYDGVITTDAAGEATVELPPWAEALNGDFRYQLTTIGSFARAIVSAKMANNRFSIKTDAPNVEVSWQVIGIRRDAWSKANPLRVELDKAGSARGKFLHPAAHGADESLGVFAGRKPRRRRRPR